MGEIAAAALRSDVAILVAKGITSFILPASFPARDIREFRTAAAELQEGIAVSKELSSHRCTFGVCLRMELGGTFSELMLEAVSTMISQGQILAYCFHDQ